MKKCVGIVSAWPKVKNAEYEVIERMKIALHHLGFGWAIVDNEGRLIEYSGGPVDGLEIDDVADFCISMHYFSPKLWSTFTYYALWNPAKYHHVLGKPYDVMMSHVGSYDDYIGYSSDPIIAQTENYFFGTPKNLHGMLDYYPGGAEPTQPVLESLPEQPRLFYCGINWETLSGDGRGRYHDLFHLLDDQNIINIYGPEFFERVKPWDGFKNYKGEIPFDGVSMTRTIRASGISLVISSEDHILCDAASSRIYEALNAGVVIVSDRNPFVVKEFADTINYFDHGRTPAETMENIKRVYDSILKDPKKYLERARQAQAIYKNRHVLDVSLKKIIEQHENRVAKNKQEFFARGSDKVTVILPIRGQTTDFIAKQLKSVENQDYKYFDLNIVLDSSRVEEVRAVLTARNLKNAHLLPIETTKPGFNVKLENLGTFVAAGLHAHSNKYFTVIDENECWMHSHLSTLVRALEDNKERSVSVSGSYFELKGTGARGLSHLEFKQQEYQKCLNLVQKNDLVISPLIRSSSAFTQGAFLKMLRNVNFKVKNVLIAEALKGGDPFVASTFVLSSSFLKDQPDGTELSLQEKISLGYVVDFFKRDKKYYELMSTHLIPAGTI